MLLMKQRFSVGLLSWCFLVVPLLSPHDAGFFLAIAHCEQVGDYGSRELFETILASEEEHIDWLETQLELIGRVGLQNYQQSMM